MNTSLPRVADFGPVVFDEFSAALIGSVAVVGLIAISFSSHPSRELRNGELIHRDGVEPPALVLIILPGSIAELLDHQDLPVRAADIRRRTLNLKLSLGQLATTAFSTSTLTSDPISMPFERRGFATFDEPVSIGEVRAVDGARGVGQRHRRTVSQLLNTGQLPQRSLVLASP
ncbi:MAG: hypothetical protein ABJA98_09135 [Acidobacteriota bacterium]